MDPLTCCILGLCCPPFSEGQLNAFTTALAAHLKDDVKARLIAARLFGDLGKFTTELAKLMVEAKS